MTHSDGWPAFRSESATWIWAHMAALPVADTHEHLRPPAALRLPMSPGRLLSHSYLTRNLRRSDGSPNGVGAALEVDLHDATWETVRPYLDRIRRSSYFRWLMRGLTELYDLDDDMLSAATWDRLSDELPARYGEAGWLSAGLDRAGVEAVIWDPYWASGTVATEDPRLIPSLRVDPWLVAFHPSAKDHDGNNVIHDWADEFDIDVVRFVDLEALIEALVRRNVAAGSRSLKFAWAYDRSLAVAAPDRSAAVKLMGRPADRMSRADRLTFGDYVVHFALEQARQHGLVIQVHTGMGRLHGSNPIHLDPLLAAYPEVVFDLFHGGFPWIHESGALAHQHPNVRLNLTWLPQLTSAATVGIIKEWIQVVPQVGRISWGGDCDTIEETYGALLAFRWATSVALGELVEERYISLEEAAVAATDLSWDAGAAIYRLHDHA